MIQSPLYLTRRKCNFNKEIYSIKDIPTLYPVDPFNPSQDAQTLRNAFSGRGTDEQATINVLCKRAAFQRDIIDTTYNNIYSKVACTSSCWFVFIHS